jgi:hypothetical protein
MAQENGGKSLFHRALREPALHFVALALLLFAASSLFGAGGEVIQVDPREVEWRVTQTGLVLGTEIDVDERRSIEDAYIEERILVREARNLGLDDDPRIDDILVQKMLHVLSGDVIQPTDEELEAYYEQSRHLFTPEASVTVEELLLSTDGPLPEPLLDQLEAGTPPTAIQTDIRAIHGVLADVTAQNLAAIFDEEMAQRVFSAPIGEWAGPHRTLRGQHWLRVTERTEPAAPPLGQVREAVRLSWIQVKEEELLARRVDELRGRYTIEVLEAEQ